MPKTAAERMQAIETRKKPCDEKAKLWIQDDWSLREVWKVPVDALVLNVDNRRFAAERLWAQEQLGRSLDPENYPDDEFCIESLLLDKSHRIEHGQIVGTSSKDYESLKNDWERRGQETPFWIRPDGTVRNGNRRLAMIKRIQRLGGDSGLTWVDAVILDPKEIDEAALLEMEQREQLTENFKVRYNDIDYLLALREAAQIREIDWFDRDSIDGVAGKLQTTVEKSRSEVVRDLYAVKYMDFFLEDSNHPGEYHRLLHTLEIFRDIGRMMMKVEPDYPDDFDRVLQVLFAGVRAGKKYEDIRQVRQMFRKDRSQFDRLAGDISDAETRIQPNDRPTLASPTQTSSDDSDEEEDGVEDSGASVTDYPPAIGRTIDIAIDRYQTSRQRDVLKTVREVVNRLESLAEGGRLTSALTDPGEGEAVRDALTEIVEWADEHRRLLDDEG
ncbi:hypothetical protein [Candidatus Thiosymbion oneisti]|uniref:hypothetical protein n=1 Tax=Candidatus Thiosymbion oneisti TaxID=589554 RepID=UPI000B7F6FD5|nr:hypothetical protein [Candidatus Thiosymbion oneisti]